MATPLISRQFDLFDERITDALARAAHTGHEAILAILVADLWRELVEERHTHEEDVTRLRAALSHVVHPPFHAVRPRAA